MGAFPKIQEFAHPRTRPKAFQYEIALRRFEAMPITD